MAKSLESDVKDGKYVNIKTGRKSYLVNGAINTAIIGGAGGAVLSQGSDYQILISLGFAVLGACVGYKSRLRQIEGSN